MTTREIPPRFLSEIYAHAEKEYPLECCGVLLGPRRSDQLTRLKVFRNCQDEWRAKEPAIFQKTSAEAYLIDPKAWMQFQK